MVIHKGKILEEKLAERHYNINDLLKQLREKSVFDPAQVEVGIEVGIIETDGKILEDNLVAAGLDVEALNNYLKANGVRDAAEVELLIVTPQGQYYLDLKEDKLTKS